MQTAEDQLKALYSAGARRVKLVCWPVENECEQCRAFKGGVLEAATAIKQRPIPPPNCPSEFCALRYLPLVDEPTKTKETRPD